MNRNGQASAYMYTWHRLVELWGALSFYMSFLGWERSTSGFSLTQLWLWSCCCCGCCITKNLPGLI